LHDTLDALHTRLAAPNPTADAEAGAVSLEQAQALFEERWLAALERERGAPANGAPAAVPSNDNDSYQLAPNPFLDVYRRHGNAIVERTWRQISAPRTVQPRTRFDADITVQVGEQEVLVTLDRVEHRGAGNGSQRWAGRNTPAQREHGEHADDTPVRIVRHRIGRAEMETADLRALLYELAAQQTANPVRPELQQQNLTTGEVRTMRLDGRKVTRLRERLDELLVGMRGGEYPPKPDPMVCPTCPFFLICPA
ncbi:MAG: PD-(D/E)XK nuclease family protein, partial [Ktedonobacterales bacterium]